MLKANLVRWGIRRELIKNKKTLNNSIEFQNVCGINKLTFVDPANKNVTVTDY
jgi:hypothetical protein